jgi:hypothetical protein
MFEESAYNSQQNDKITTTSNQAYNQRYAETGESNPSIRVGSLEKSVQKNALLTRTAPKGGTKKGTSPAYKGPMQTTEARRDYQRGYY